MYVVFFLSGDGFLGTHASWTMAYFLLKLSGVKDIRIECIDEKFQSAVPRMTTATQSCDFHSPLSLAEVLNGTTNNPVMGLSTVCKPVEIVSANCHTPGI